MTPEVLQKIGRLYLQGKTRLEIAVEIDVAEGTVSHHLDATIKPLWRNSVQFDAAIECARADEVIRLAFEGYERSRRDQTKEREKQVKRAKDAAKENGKLEQLVERTADKMIRDGERAWLQLVLAAMDFKAKVKGGYAPKRINIKAESELRIAGSTPAELETKMVNRIAELLAEKRRHQQIIDQAARNAGEG